jgi:hypothetical protein
MIDPQELAICKRRGHQPQGSSLWDEYWKKCRWCGMWLREVRTVALEEREDEPPEAERDRPVDVHLNQLLKAMKGKKEGKKS